MDNPLQKTLPRWQLFLYLLMMGFTFIVAPKSSTGLVVARIVQLFELIFLAVLLLQYGKQGIRFNAYNTLINMWWLIYTFLAYIGVQTTVGMTPFFKWMNIIIFLLLGTSYWAENLQHSLKYMAIACSVLIYLNAILLILYPNGLWIDEEWIGHGDPTRYLFGNYNQSGFVCLLGITIQAMYTSITNRGYINLIILVLVSISSVLFVGSMTSTVSLCLLAFFILLRNIIRHHAKLFVTIFFVFYFLFFIIFIWLGNSIDEISWATQFIENTLSKDTSFSNRTTLWSNSVYQIQQSLWTGFGIQNIEWNDMYLGGSGPHNLLLMLLLQGGILLCFSFVGIIFYAIKYAINTPSNTNIISIVSLCVLLIMSLFETYNIVQTFLFIQLVYYSSFYVKNESSKILNVK